MNKIIKAILRQHETGHWWGAFSQTLGQITAFVTLFNMLLLIPTAYVTWFAPWANDVGIRIGFGVFISVILISGIVLLFIAYKILIPSSVSFQSNQAWEHNNPMRKKLA